MLRNYKGGTILEVHMEYKTNDSVLFTLGLAGSTEKKEKIGMAFSVYLNRQALAQMRNDADVLLKKMCEDTRENS